MTEVKGVIFDMDGTMLDNADFHQFAWLKFLEKHGVEMTEKEYHKKLFGRTSKEIMKTVFDRDLSDEELEEYSQEKESMYRELYRGKLKPNAGLLMLLRDLKFNGVKIGLATSSIRKNLEFTLKELDMDSFFEATTSSKDISQSKPHPEIFLKTIQDLGLEPEECVIFEDSPSGLEAAKRARVTIIAINPSDEEKALEYTKQIYPDFKSINYEKILTIKKQQSENGT